MRRRCRQGHILGVLLLFLCIALPAHAASLQFIWSASPGADGYRLYRCRVGSNNRCNAWTLIKTINDGQATSTTYTEATETRLVIYRLAAFTTAGEIGIQLKSGSWYDGRQQ
jgi:hypothetical protein